MALLSGVAHGFNAPVVSRKSGMTSFLKRSLVLAGRLSYEIYFFFFPAFLLAMCADGAAWISLIFVID
jgi:hypothetical protein